MQTISTSQYAVWIASPLLLFFIAFVLYRNVRGYSFPWFIGYLLWVGITTYFQLGVRFLHAPYFAFYTYWMGQAVAILLSFLVLFEVSRNVLTSGTLPISKSNFILVNAFLLIAAALVATKLQGGDTEPMMYAILVFSRTARFVQVGFMLILVALSLFFGFYWSSQAFGIAAGFGFFASIELINSTVRALLGPTGNKIWGWVSVLSYQGAAMIWLAYALKGRKSVDMQLPEDKLPAAVLEFALNSHFGKTGQRK